MLARSAPKQFSPNAFLRNTVTIHVGDTVRWRFRGFHTVTFPVRGKQPPPFALPSPTQKVVVASGGGAATDELNSLIRQARQTAAQPAKGPLTVDLGRAPAGRRFTINAFFPSTINVRVGQTVQFTTAGQNPNEIHTVTLGPLTRAQLPFVDNRGNINPRTPTERPAAGVPAVHRDEPWRRLPQPGAARQRRGHADDPERQHGDVRDARDVPAEVPRARGHGRDGDGHSVAIAAATACGASRGRPWPAPGTSSSRAPGSASARRRPMAA